MTIPTGADSPRCFAPPLINVGDKGVVVSPYSVRLKRNHETRSKSVDKRKTGRYNEIPFYGREQAR